MPSELFVEVCQIDSLLPHNNADRLEIAMIKGWQCVVQKGCYTVGQKIVYFPIDSVLPTRIEEIIFGEDAKVKLKNSRVKTIKLRGVISQGLTAPLDILEIAESTKLGTDVKEVLGITKYEVPQSSNPMSGCQQTSRAGGNINFGKYTSINHLKNFPYGLIDKYVIVHEKIHGTNFRCGMVTRAPHTLWEKIKSWFSRDKQEFVYGSHNVQLKPSTPDGYIPGNIYYKTTVDYNLREIIGQLKLSNPSWENVCIYGEIYGDGIQKNYSYGCKKGETKLVIFDIKVDGEYIRYSLLEDILSNNGLPSPPKLYQGTYDPDKISLLASGNSILVPSQKIIEGVVVRSGGVSRDIFKHINPEYLLKDNTEWT